MFTCDWNDIKASMSVGMVRDEADSTTPRIIMHLENIITANINVKPNIGFRLWQTKKKKWHLRFFNLLFPKLYAGKKVKL